MNQRNTKSTPAKLTSIDPGQWVINHADYLYAFAMERINDPETARDLVQETFLAALEGIEGFEKKCTEKTWLTAILKNKIFDIYRKKSIIFSNSIMENSKDILPHFFQQESGHWKLNKRPYELAINDKDTVGYKELEDILQKCIKKLPGFWQHVFSMKFVEEKKAANICAALKITSANYWVIIHRVKISLRDCLQRHWD